MTVDHQERWPVVEEVSSWLTRPADEVDRDVVGGERERVLDAVRALNHGAREGHDDAFYAQQLLLGRIYGVLTRIPSRPSAEGSVVLHEVTHLLEGATMAAEDGRVEPGTIEGAPSEGKAYVAWLKHMARQHRSFRHPYYEEFIHDHASRQDLRTYVIQESAVDGRFDDLLAMMQVGTSGAAKMEIASNFWDEMGNGDPTAVHTRLFNQIFDVFDIDDDEIELALSANALLSGNLAVLLCRYRRLFPEAVGYLGMTEWLVPLRFRSVVRAWERLDLPEIGIVYHRLHIPVDSHHAAGWFRNVVEPAAGDEFMRRGIARGALWRLNASTRYLDECLASAMANSRTSLAAPSALAGEAA
jgi:pyrroloquinoline quinone (PQQ) biosynthesis protein C